MNNSEIAVIIPVFNEEKTIGKVIKDFITLNRDLNIYIVDNNSTDNTIEVAKNAFKEYDFDGKILKVKKQGKANAVREAFRTIDSDIFVLIDGDYTYFASDLDNMLKPILEENVDMVVGNRFIDGGYDKENKRKFHSFGNKLVRSLINLLYKANLTDIMSGYRVLSRRLVKNYPIMCEGFELETEMTLHCLDKKFKIKEIPITYKNREFGSVSKLNTFRDGFKIIKTIFIIFKDYKPLVFFSILSFLSLLIGLILGAFPVYEFIKYKYVYRVPTAILATGFVIVSLILFAIALILDTICKYQRYNFELNVLNFNREKT